jgi:hypothetical protein
MSGANLPFDCWTPGTASVVAETSTSVRPAGGRSVKRVVLLVAAALIGIGAGSSGAHA